MSVLPDTAFAQFESLPKTGKPQPHEHTVLAAIAVTFLPETTKSFFPNCQQQISTFLDHPRDDDDGGGGGGAADAPYSRQQQQKSEEDSLPVIVALATGTKSLAGTKRAVDGSALHDCHAEVLCRRAFLRWAYAEIAELASNRTSRVFQLEPCPSSPASNQEGQGGSISNSESTITLKATLLPGVKIHMFVSMPPCGDAAILCTANNTNGNDNIDADNDGRGRTGAKPMVKRRKLSIGGNYQSGEAIDGQPPLPPPAASAPPTGIIGTTTTTSTTTPTYLPEARDVESYAAPQLTGVVRRKPGRGSPTLSVSCSDKIMKWSLLGIQGAFMSSLLSQPLHLHSLNVGVVAVQPSSSENEAPPISSPEIEVEVDAALQALQRACVDRVAQARQQHVSTTTSTNQSNPPPALLKLGVVQINHRRLHKVGLVAGEGRRVPCGTSVTWWADRSTAWKCKTTGSNNINNISITKESQVDGKLVEKNSSCSTSTTPSSASCCLVLAGGTVEAVTGLLGIKAGAARRGADAVPMKNQSSLCRAALFREFQRVLSLLIAKQASGGRSDTKSKVLPPANETSYAQAKLRFARPYVDAWKSLVLLETSSSSPSSSCLRSSSEASPFEGWISKPDTEINYK